MRAMYPGHAGEHWLPGPHACITSAHDIPASTPARLSPMQRRIATRLSIVLVIIVATSAILMGIAVTQSGTHLLINASTTRLAQESKVVSIRLQDIFEFVRRDIEFLVRSPAVHAVVNAMDSGVADAAEAAVCRTGQGPTAGGICGFTQQSPLVCAAPPDRGGR